MESNTLKTKEVELIKVLTIKKKHIEGLREAFSRSQSFNMNRYDMLGYISEWDAILIRNKETKHIALVQATIYYSNYDISELGKGSWDDVHRERYNEVHSLPQIFLD